MDFGLLFQKIDNTDSLLELDIIPFDALFPDSDKSHYIIQGNHVALNSNHITLLFSDSMSEIKQFQDLIDCDKMIYFQSNSSESKNLNWATLVLLMIQPECSTAWNIRRKIYCRINTEFEFKFTTFLLTKHPKRAAIWSYREWIHKTIRPPIKLNCENDIFFLAAHLYKSNYHAWHYRRSVLLPELNPEIELNQVFQWIKTHIYDYSAWFYYLQLVNEHPSFKKSLQLEQLDKIYTGNQIIKWALMTLNNPN